MRPAFALAVIALVVPVAHGGPPPTRQALVEELRTLSARVAVVTQQLAELDGERPGAPAAACPPPPVMDVMTLNDVIAKMKTANSAAKRQLLASHTATHFLFTAEQAAQFIPAATATPEEGLRVIEQMVRYIVDRRQNGVNLAHQLFPAGKDRDRAVQLIQTP